MEHNKQKETETPQIYEKLLRDIDQKMSSWTQEEDTRLLENIHLMKSDWEKCSNFNHQKDSFDCFRRYIFLTKQNTKGTWTKIEDTFLTNYVNLLGRDQWNQVGSLVPGRSSKQCRERWNNQLNPKIKTCRFTQEERMLLVNLQRQFGNKWTKISTYFQGRTGNQLKNFWHSNIGSKNRLKRSIKRNEKLLQEKKKIQKRKKPRQTKIKRRRKNKQKKIIVVRRRNNQKKSKSVDHVQFQNKNQDLKVSLSQIDQKPAIEINPKIEIVAQTDQNDKVNRQILNFSLLKVIDSFNATIPKQKTIPRKRTFDQTIFNTETTNSSNTVIENEKVNVNGNLNVNVIEKVNVNENVNVNVNVKENENESILFSQNLLNSNETTTIPSSPKEKNYEFFQINEMASEDDSYEANNTLFGKKELSKTNFHINSDFNIFEPNNYTNLSDIHFSLYNDYSDFMDMPYHPQTEQFSTNFFLDNF
ncbi:snRNA-activating protein complex subunit [Anaeramoeba flamelloides]|uniref:snRNA-activating protein complex subunit n=1 Tax=Anaeramoeba flamelloides TaxID=1746091 RepID=A0AAV7YJI0_9EUKA|nr:snRNA-activating protein complex subunit [Anaeramoeba flamelloides]